MKKLVVAIAVGVAMGAGLPAVAAADTTVDTAVAAFKGLGLAPLTAMPDNRQVYRSYEDYNADMQALATANPSLVAYKLAPNKTIEGRDVHYVEITNNVTANDGKPVFYIQGAIHGNESAAAEDSMEFAIDVVNQSKANPAVSALLDRVRVVVLPLVNPDGYEHKPSPRRYNCDSATPLTPPLTCPTSTQQGVDMNRNYPTGWGSGIGVNLPNRGSGPGSEPEVKNTMSIIAGHQVVALITAHTNERAIFYPPFDLNAGDTPELNTGYKALAQAMLAATNNGYTNTRDSAHDYETTGETNDWSYYATRGFGFTQELIGPVAGCPQALPNYLNCTTADFTGHAGPTSTAAQTATFEGHPVRDAWWTVLVYASLPAGHSVISGSATPGATLKIAKDFTLYTAPVATTDDPSGPTTAPLPMPTHLESSMTVPADGKFRWDTNPSVRPQSAYYADGEHMGPNGFVKESYTITCTAADGTLLSTSKVLVDKGDVANISLCTQAGVGGSVAATLALTLGAPAGFGAFTPGVAKDYTASTTATVISTAGDAALSVADSSPTATGHLVNGTFALPSGLQAGASGTLADVGGAAAPTLLKTWSAPASNDLVTVTFGQHVGAADALRTGAYTKTLTFTLSTTNP